MLDVLLRREPHVKPATRLMTWVEAERLDGLLGATTVTTIHYLAERAVGRRAARSHVGTLLALFDVAPVNGAVLSRALVSPLGDYEDAVLCEAALAASAEGIVTRDTEGFAGAALPAYTPEELLAALRSA